MAITHDFVTIDSCDDPTVWTPTGQGAVSLNTVNYRQGSGALNIFKTGTEGVDFGAYKTIPATDMNNKILALWLYVDVTALSKLKIARLYIYDDSGNYFYWDLTPARMRTGWNKYVFTPTTTSTSGWSDVIDLHIYPGKSGTSPTTPNLSAITKIALYFETYTATDTTPEGSLVIDFIVLGRNIYVTGGTATSPLTLDNLKSDLDSTKLPIYTYTTYEVTICSILHIGIGQTAGCYLQIKNGNLWIYAIGTSGGDYIVIVEQYGNLIFGEKVTSGNYVYGQNGGILGAGKLGNFGYNYVRSYGGFYIYASRLIIPSGMDVIGTATEIIDSIVDSDGIAFPSDAIIVNTTFLKLTRFWGQPARAERIGVIQKIWSGYSNPPYGLIIDEPYFQPNAYITAYYRNQVTVRDPNIIPQFSADSPDINNQGWVLFSFYVQLVDEGGTPIAGASYKIYDKNGVLRASGTTDSNGFTAVEYLPYIHWWYDTSTRTVKSETFNPYRIIVTKDSVKYQDYVFTIDKKFRGVIPIHTMRKATAWVEKPYYLTGENVIMKAKFTDWLDTPITGLSVNATVTKPDGTQETITLRDDGIPPDETANDGIYTGTYTNTNQVGTYYVEISTTIYGNTVKARASFNVGIIEKRIDEAKTEIISEIDVKTEEVKTQITEYKPGAVFTLGT